MSGAIINSDGHPKMPEAVMPPSLPSPPLHPLPSSSLFKELGTPLSGSHSARPLSTIPLWLPETFCILYRPSNVSISTSITVILLLVSSASTSYDWSHFTASCIYITYTYYSYRTLTSMTFRFLHKRKFDSRFSRLRITVMASEITGIGQCVLTKLV